MNNIEGVENKMDREKVLITTTELERIENNPDVRILDVRYSLDGRDQGYELFEAGHIPGASYLHWLDDWSDPDDPVEGQLAPPEHFAKAMRSAGVDDDSHIVVYDDAHLFMAARMLWALRVYGHDNVQVLDGGFPKWVHEDRAVDQGASVDREEGAFSVPQRVQDLRLTKDDVQALVEQSSGPLLDCRMDRTWDETGQHIPGAGRLPSPTLVHEDGTLRSAEEIQTMASQQGVDQGQPVALYCGGGVSAAQAWLALTSAGFTQAKVYDGSWSEWSQDPKTPKESH